MAWKWAERLHEQLQVHVIAQAILSGLGYAGRCLQLIQASAPEEQSLALRNLKGGEVPKHEAGFNAFVDKRNTLDFALDHLFRHVPVGDGFISLPAEAPFGSLQVNTAACTLCMSCTGVCPTSALNMNEEKPQLRFIKKLRAVRFMYCYLS